MFFASLPHPLLWSCLSCYLLSYCHQLEKKKQKTPYTYPLSVPVCAKTSKVVFCRLCPYFLISQSCLVLCSLHLIPSLCRDLECFWWGQYLHAAPFKWPCLVLVFISLTVAFSPVELFKYSPSWRISVFCLKWLHSSLVSFKVLFFFIQPGAYFWTILSGLILFFFIYFY